MKRQFVGVLLIVLIFVTIFLSWALMQAEDDSDSSSLEDVGFWVYQIDGIDSNGAVNQLVTSYYDLIVVEPTRSIKDSIDFDSKNVVSQIHASPGANVISKIIIAYINIGEAEDWRWYWKDNWTTPTETSRGNPDFLLSVDPDGWEGNYPVAFWDDRWKDIILYDEVSSIQQILDDGFDGIYMDWIGAYEHEPVMDAGESDGLDAQQEMIDFISEIRTYCHAQNPNFFLIAQNALDIYEGHTEYFEIIDAIAQEHILFDGIAETGWGEDGSGDERVSESDTEWYVEYLDRYLAEGITVLIVDYALELANIDESYSFAATHGYIGFVTQISLSQIPDVYPPGYPS